MFKIKKIMIDNDLKYRDIANALGVCYDKVCYMVNIDCSKPIDWKISDLQKVRDYLFSLGLVEKTFDIGSLLDIV